MKRVAKLCSLFAATLLVLAAPASAGTLTLTGVIDSSDPQMPVVFISTPECTSLGAALVYYEARPFYVTAPGTYNLSLASAGGFASLYLYELEFDPTNGLLNCIAASNSGDPVEIDEGLIASRQYIAVPFDDQFAQLGGSYELTISGPGDIREGSASVLEIPTASTLGLLVLAALLSLGGLFFLRRLRAV